MLWRPSREIAVTRRPAGTSLLCLIAIALVAAAAVGSAAPDREDPFEAQLQRSGSEELLGSWRRARALVREALEQTDEDPARARQLFLDSIALFDEIGAAKTSGEPHWRSARSHWLLAENLPLDAKQERIAHFTRADERAADGLAVDPRCAPCMLWRFTAMGRIRTTQSVLEGLSGVSEMAELLDEGIALEPTHRDSPNNSTLGNLHYGSAIFYRVLPDWTWLGWVLGVRGDKERALGHARQALALHPARLDYQLEVGSQLMCLGSSEREPPRIAEGARLLEALLDRTPHDLREQRQLAAAEIMLSAPEKSCGYTGDTWVEIDAREAAQVAADR